MASLNVAPVASLRGEIRPASDKSLTHRAYLLAALASGHGQSVIRRPLTGDDCRSTAECLAALGVPILPAEQPGEDALVPAGHTLRSPESWLDCGNSGTTMRLLCGVLASVPGMAATLTGDASLSKRPMGRVAEPLRVMGATVEGDRPPVTVKGAVLKGIDYETPVASAQIKSAILLAGLRAEGETWVKEPSPSRDHTERMLAALGVEVMTRRDGSVGVAGGATWSAFQFTVPADVSGAAFFMVGAACLPDASVTLHDIGLNPTRTGVLDALAAAGAGVVIERAGDELGEPVGTVIVRGGRPLRSFEVSGSLVPRLIDEIPILSVLATQCDGVTEIRDAAELRVKESDRIATIAEGLRAMGARVEERPDGLIIEGPVRLKGAEIEAHGDHRIAMAFAVAGLVAEGQTTIHGAESITTSYPDFMADLESLCVY